MPAAAPEAKDGKRRGKPGTKHDMSELCLTPRIAQEHPQARRQRHTQVEHVCAHMDPHSTPTSSHVTAASLTAVSPVSGRSLQSHLIVAVVADKGFEEGFGPLTQIAHPTQQRHPRAKALCAAYTLGRGLAWPGLEFCPLVSLLAIPPAPVFPPPRGRIRLHHSSFC